MTTERPHRTCCHCEKPAEVFFNNGNYCTLHLRIMTMRKEARKWGKADPGRERLERMFSELRGMACADCGLQMVMRRVEMNSPVVSLQHYRDGSFGLVCPSCNTKHHYMPGDTYREFGGEFKHCSGCSQTLPRSEFYTSRGVPSYQCRPCTIKYRRERRARGGQIRRSA